MPSLDDLIPPMFQGGGGGAPPCTCHINPATCPTHVKNPLDQLVAQPGFAPREWQAASPPPVYNRAPPVCDSQDLQRVLALPRRPQLDLKSARAAALVQLITGKYGNGRPAGAGCLCRTIDKDRSCITTLLPIQAWALHEVGLANGLLGAISVGAGKTIVALLTPLALPGCRRALLLVPPSLIDQLIDEYQLLSQHFVVPSLEVHPEAWGRKAPPINGVPAPELHVLPYSRLSLTNASDWIARVARPDVIIADECDRLRDLGTATTSRVMRYFAAFGNTRFCGWTGSLTDQSISEYAHLAVLALRLGSPLPLDMDTAADWGRAIDAKGDPELAGDLLRMCAPGEHIRKGYNRRLSETLGVVISSDNDVMIEGTDRKVEIVVRERAAPVVPQIILDALDRIAEGFRPDTMAGGEQDEELVDALAKAKAASEVACGIFYKWKFPPINGIPQSRDHIKQWYACRKAWNKELRQRLLARMEHLDSPKLCEYAAERAWGDRPKRRDRPEWNAKSWPAWRDIRKSVLYQPQGVRISDYLVNDAADWAVNNHGIVWYSMVEFGSWIAEKTGLALHTGGPKAAKRLKEDPGDRSIIASLKSHGRGRNGLQFRYANQLVANVPASATAWEQLLGRLHRRGQKAESVYTDVYTHTNEFRKSIAQALRRASYVQGTIGAQQKLLAGWEGDELLWDDDEYNR